MAINYKYIMAYYGICRVIQLGMLVGVQVAMGMTDDSLRLSCKIFVHIASGIVLLSCAIYLIWHMIGTSKFLTTASARWQVDQRCKLLPKAPARKQFATSRWQEGFHDALSALVLLVVSTVLLMQNLTLPIGITVFLSLSCALCFAVQGFSNYSSGRQIRKKSYIGQFEVAQQNGYIKNGDDQFCLKEDKTGNTDADQAMCQFSILSDDDDDDDDDEMPLTPRSSKEKDGPLPTITVHNPNEVEKALLLESSQKLKVYKDTLVTGAATTPEPGDRSGLSEYVTPHETRSGLGNARAAEAVACPSPVPWDTAAFSAPPQKDPTTPHGQDYQEELLVDVESPDITFNIKPMKR